MNLRAFCQKIANKHVAKLKKTRKPQSTEFILIYKISEILYSTFMKDILEAYNSCILCPHNCQVNRNKGEVGVCGETADLRVAFAGLHFGEEPIITGNKGSGTIFVTGCNLGCVFCQNFQISQEKMGKSVSLDEFVEICLRLQNAGAENINIVTGSHAIPFLALALSMAKNKGLVIPICWNSSAYENIEALELLDGLVDN